MMKGISRRAFVAAGAGLLGLCKSFIPGRSHMAYASEYTPPTDHPYSKERLEAEAMARQAPKPQVVKVCENLYSAIGYAFATIIMVLTPDGVVVIDTTESLSAAREVMGELRKITNLPVKAVIYTHNHADHWFGTKAFFNSGVQVIAHENFAREVKLQEGRGDSGRIRAAAMYGLLLPESMRVPWLTTYPWPVAVNLRWEGIKPEDMVWPAKTFKDRHSFEIGGVTFQLLHAPGETPDQIIVHIPQYKVVCPADNYYATFPNLYTIRSTSSRPVLGWAAAQDTVMKLEPEYLVPGHGAPLAGKDKIKEVLTNYRDAILHVHNLAFEAVQKFKPLDEVVAKASLPPHLANLPYLKEYYGYIPFCVRSIYQSYVGWFDGVPANLQPLSRTELGADILKLVGSAEKILEYAARAQKEGRHRIVLELCEMVLAKDPKNRTARMMKISSMVALGRATAN
jgi:alkyl sulfatase BDS1-like metallo-beta-lactamase superfamily hydrolase